MRRRARLAAAAGVYSVRQISILNPLIHVTQFFLVSASEGLTRVL